MPELSNLSIVLPILILVVLKMCDIARSIDLTEILEEDMWVIHEEGGFYLTPFSLLHMVNYLTLSYIVAGLYDMYSGGILVGLLWNLPSDPILHLIIVAFGIFLLLPLLEVKGYSHADTFSFYPVPGSYIAHLFGVIFFIVALVVGEEGRQIRPSVESVWQIPSAWFEIVTSHPDLVILDIIAMIAAVFWLIGGVSFLPAVHSELVEDSTLGSE